MVKCMEELTDEERRALRGSKFAPLPPPKLPSSSSTASFPRIAHPGGPVKTNKAVALAKFLGRKLQEPGGLDSLKPELVELAVKNAKETVNASGTSNPGRVIQHVASFEDFEGKSSRDGSDTEPMEKLKKVKKEKKEKKKKQQQKKKKKKKLKVLPLIALPLLHSPDLHPLPQQERKRIEFVQRDIIVVFPSNLLGRHRIFNVDNVAEVEVFYSCRANS